MQIRKIIAKNFLTPGQQEFVFNENQVLTGGVFNNSNDLVLLNELINGSWLNSTISFEKYYPKFAKELKKEEMDFQIDALISITSKELEELNNILKVFEQRRPYKSTIFYYSIRCFYPYIFPIISLIPAEFPTEIGIGIGTHYDKFFKSGLSKIEMLEVLGIHAVGKLRERYYEYKTREVRDEQKIIFKRYLDSIKSTFRYDEEFIKKLGQAINNIDDGDIINYADEVDFFLRNEQFKNFLDTIPLLREDEMFRRDFANLLFEVYLVYLKWIYSIKTANHAVEIRKNLHKNFCERAVFSKELIKFLNVVLKTEKKQFNYSAPASHFKNNLDQSLVYTDEPKYENVFEKGFVEPKIIEPKKFKKYKIR